MLADPGVLILSRHNPRGIIEIVNSAFPGEHVPSPRRAAGRTLRSVRRNGHVVLQRSFWTGVGTLVQPPHRFAAAAPHLARREIEEFGFSLLDQLPSTYPFGGHSLTAPWFYFAFAIGHHPADEIRSSG